MNDAKCKRGLRVPSASITLVTTSVFSTKGGQVAARQRYHSSSIARPFSRLRHRQRGQMGLRHACLLNKACALAALHAHTHRRDVFVYHGFRPRSADPTFPALVCLAGGRWSPLSGGVGQQLPPPPPCFTNSADWLQTQQHVQTQLCRPAFTTICFIWSRLIN